MVGLYYIRRDKPVTRVRISGRLVTLHEKGMRRGFPGRDLVALYLTVPEVAE